MRTPILYGSVHILFYRKDEVLLLKRQNTGFQDGNWSVVAGRMDGNEEVVAAAIREAKEEAGVIIEPEQMEVVGMMHRKNTTSEWVDFFLIAHDWEGEITNMEPEKCEQLKWFHVRELPDNMISYIRTAVEHKHEGLWFESVGWK
ncbi:NUDIX hydrolase [Paenibacillus aceris]|uniref:8-oxo-dGTP pyrophosphatase MutT (NUDIX family) n=1 Tax=Paenibacillus aceris TaxID=869555 RepID=A0ABS4IA36_9BACL|nr:NUDIX domain-containing protein [Paenibacillus aceris]MBP1967797.1 8-oxo-dGTP pyrophosphatase MutT (NUDIX family) [Paenibacillus aceris]NHW38223.1 NUDIX domain-containing protein [Paenibacillus aceris]